MVEFQQVCMAYKEKEVLNNVDLTIQDGEFFVLIGSSGCGKTTLLKSINKLPAVTNPKEELKKNGMTVTEYTPEMIKRFYEATAGVRADWTQKIGPDVVKAAEEDMKAAK